MAHNLEDFGELQLNTAISQDDMFYNRALGYMQISDALLPDGTVRLVGFGAPLSSNGGFDTSEVVQPLVDFNDLHADNRSVDEQGKGVGPRMYNTPQGVHGLDKLPDTFGIYTYELAIARILDKRDTEGGKLTRVLRHGSRMLQGMGNLEKLVTGIHESYGNADAVLFTQPPRADVRQRLERKVENPDGYTAEFMIIRNAAIELHRIGSVQRRG